MRAATFPRPRRSLEIFSGFNTLQFASVMAMVVFVLLLVLMMNTTPHGGISADLPKVPHPIAMPDADREDAMKIMITRDGQVYLRRNRVNPADLPGKIAECLKDHDVEHEVYITADARARWGIVKLVLEGVHEAGILRVAFLADQRRFP